MADFTDFFLRIPSDLRELLHNSISLQGMNSHE